MIFLSLRKTQRALLLSGISTALLLSFNAEAATSNSSTTGSTQSRVEQANQVRASAANSADGIIALVDSNAILKSDLLNAIAQTQARAQAAGNPIPNSAQLQSEVLNALILRELQLALIERVGLRADEAAINRRLAEIAQAEGLNSISALQQRLDASQPGTYATLRKSFMEDAAIQTLQQRQISNRVRITEQDIDAFLASPEAKRLNQSEYRTIHIRVPYVDDYSRLSQQQRDTALAVAQSLRARLQQPNVDIASVIADSQSEYPIEIQGGDMGFNKATSLPTELADEITGLEVGAVSAPFVTPQGIDIIKLIDKRSDDTIIVPQWHTRHILVEVDELQTDALAEQKINDLYEQLRQGADFEALAATYSDDPGSAGRGGDLGWVSEEDMIGPFEAVMKSTPVGDYSTPFKTQFGWHILKVEEERQEDVTQEYRRNMARQALYQRLAPQAREDWLQELRAGAYIQVIE